MTYDNGCSIEWCKNNRTGNSMYCYQHMMQRRRNGEAPVLVKSPPVDLGVSLSSDELAPSSADEAIDNMHDVFDDFAADGADVTTQTFSDEASSVIRGAVSSEFMRNAERLDIDDEYARIDASQGMAEYLSSSFNVRANAMSSDDAYELAHSSSDRHGRSLEDASHLAGFALHQKYHYGRQKGLRTDENEIPFSLPEHEFIKEHEELMRQEVLRQVAIECYNYNANFREHYGRPPKIDSPIENPALRRFAVEEDSRFDTVGSISPDDSEKAMHFIAHRIQKQREEEERRRQEVEKRRRESEAMRAEIAENERLRRELEESRKRAEEAHRARLAEQQRPAEPQLSPEDQRRRDDWEREMERRDRRAEVAKAVSSKLIHGFFDGVEKRAEKKRRGAEEFYRKQEERKREKEREKLDREMRKSRHLQDRANEEIIRRLRRGKRIF